MTAPTLSDKELRKREREKRENKTNKILLSLGGDQGWFPHSGEIYFHIHYVDPYTPHFTFKSRKVQ